MSDTTSKRKDDDSPTSQVVNADDEELDDDLDNALFGDDEDVAEPAEADADAKAEVAPVTGGVRRPFSCFRDADCAHDEVGYNVLRHMAMTKAQKQKKLLHLVIRQLSESSLKTLLGSKQRNEIGAGWCECDKNLTDMKLAVIYCNWLLAWVRQKGMSVSDSLWNS